MQLYFIKLTDPYYKNHTYLLSKCLLLKEYMLFYHYLLYLTNMYTLYNDMLWNNKVIKKTVATTLPETIGVLTIDVVESIVRILTQDYSILTLTIVESNVRTPVQQQN